MNSFNDIVAGSLNIAQNDALERKNPSLEPLHLFWGLLANPATFVSRKLKNKKSEAKKRLKQLPSIESQDFSIDKIKPSPAFSQWITQASSRAIQAGRQEIQESDLLFYLPKLLPELDINPSDLSEVADGSDEESERPPFLVDLNELAQKGKLDPVIGRTREIRSVMEILGRRSKNNPVLVGDAGVGKTAVVEGLAEMIHRGKTPDALKDKRIYSLDLGALMAGTKFRGEFEERLQKLLKFLKTQSGAAILFIDEIHQLVGAGKTDGAIDAANLLKPALARGELHCIGATTHDEYQKYILSDGALDRRFRSVPINEPSTEDAIEIMLGIKEKFEIHHGIEILDEAIYASVFLSQQYLPNKNLPDKAIDLIDEASAALKLSAEAMPAHLVDLQAEIRAKSVFSKTEKSNKETKKEISALQKRFDSEKEKWEKEVLAIKRVSELKNNLDRHRFELQEAEEAQDYEKASRIKYSLIPELEAELEKSQHAFKLKPNHIAEIISRQTGIPVEKILKSKQENLLELEDFLKTRVLGQDEAIHEVSETLIASHAGLTDSTRPLGSFLLMGPSGVGKTETAKAVTEFLFDSEENLIRLDLSEFSEKHSVAKLIGAPAGYVGYEEGGILTEAVRRRPYSVILMDEVEKAHPDFSDILLQILDDGRLTDNKGRTISFRNTVLFLTTNSKDIHQDFKPEVLGRLDCHLEYEGLKEETMKKLVARQVKLLNARLSEKKLEVSLSEDVTKELVKRGFDSRFGARPLNSVFSKLVTRPLSRQILSGTLKEGRVSANLEAGNIVLQ